MSGPRVMFAAMGGVMLLHCVVSLIAEGFPAGGISFFASYCAFRLALSRSPLP